MSRSHNQKPDYGLDAPGLIRTFTIIGLIAGLVATAILLSPWPDFRWLAVAIAVYTFGMAGFMRYWSRSVKVRRRDRLLGYIPWRGDEAVLDVGCGRGLLLVAAAHRVPRGGVVGVDIWQAADQADNRPEAAIENAQLEGVADQVTIETADMRQLPCQDAAFDIVVSHWAVHNLEDSADRAQALREMVRVLKPGGYLLLADIAHHADYARQLDEYGMSDVREVENGWGTQFGWIISLGSFRPAVIVAHKP